MKRFLLDENIAAASARRLRGAGHDVAHPPFGASDQSVLQQAFSERRILVTYDRDFGFLLFRAASPLPAGVVYVRTAPTMPTTLAEELLALLATPSVSIEGKLTVLEPGRIRQRPLPGS